MTVFKVIYKCSFQIIWKDERDDVNLPSFARTQGSSPAHRSGVDTKHPAPGFWKQMRIGQGLNPSGIKQAERQTKDALDKILCSFSWKLKLQEVAFFKVLILFPPIQRGHNVQSSPFCAVLEKSGEDFVAETIRMSQSLASSLSSSVCPYSQSREEVGVASQL